MGSDFATMQRIVRLAPLADALASFAPIAPAASREVALSDAGGRVLAADLRAPAARPDVALAARDGWAVAADHVSDASAYAPMPVRALWVDAGEPLPQDTDAVLPPEAMSLDAGVPQALAAASAGDGVLMRGADAAGDAPLGRGGRRLRLADVAALRACGIETCHIREPRIAIIAAPGPRREGVAAFVGAAVMAAGGVASCAFTEGGAGALERALRDAQADAIITIGGTGAGRNDLTVRTVAALGRVDHHGVAIAPGETAAVGALGNVPVLMLPGRLDAALAGWLLLGRAFLRRLGGAADDETEAPATLTRKITSTIGLTEIVLVRRSDDGLTPMAAGLLPMQTIVQADGYVRVPPESEGFATGATVMLRTLP